MAEDQPPATPPVRARGAVALCKRPAAPPAPLAERGGAVCHPAPALTTGAPCYPVGTSQPLWYVARRRADASGSSRKPPVMPSPSQYSFRPVL